jgi:hypothetical protein
LTLAVISVSLVVRSSSVTMFLRNTLQNFEILLDLRSKFYYHNSYRNFASIIQQNSINLIYYNSELLIIWHLGEYSQDQKFTS